MSYYKKFSLIISNPLWRAYLRWAYRSCLKDLAELKFKPNFNKKAFTCLLCGVGNETTADEFIKLVLSKTINPKIIIIDAGKEQIDAVEKLIKQKYSNLNIVLKKFDALKLDQYLRPKSIDWIETDAFLEYFTHQSLDKLIKNWKHILTKEGFITTRAFSSDGLGILIDFLRTKIGKIWPGVTLYRHTSKTLNNLFTKNNFHFTKKPTPLPTFKRYSIINS